MNLHSHTAYGRSLVWLSLLFALLIHLWPLPWFIVWSLPSLPLLTLIYWSMALPHRYGIGMAWIVGFLLDIFYHAPLGLHALSFSLITYLILRLRQRLWLLPRLAQTLAVMGFVALHLLLSLWIRNLMKVNAHFQWYYWIPILSTLLIWPLWFALLERLRTYAKIS